jgi:hypothetical protein
MKHPSVQKSLPVKGGVKGDALVIEVIVKFVVETLDVLERRNDLLQIVVLKPCITVCVSNWGSGCTRPQAVHAHLLLAKNRIVHLGMRLR